MEKRANNTSTQTPHPVNRVGLETKRQIGINPVMPGGKQSKNICSVLRLNFQVQLSSDIHYLIIVEKKLDKNI